MKQSRRGISGSIALLVVVVIIAAAFYVEIPTVASSSTTSSIIETTTPRTTSTSASGGSTGTLTFKIPQPLMVAPGQDESVSVAFSALGNISGNYTLGATGLPSGVTATFQPGSVVFPAGLSNSVTMTLHAATGAAVVNSTVNVKATAGSSVFSQPFPIMSVQALVLIQGSTFVPNSLTVTAGTKVYWLNLDPSSSPDLGPDMHDVTAVDHSFSSGAGALGQYAIYGHTFTAAGTVPYESTSPSQFNGQVVVTG